MIFTIKRVREREQTDGQMNIQRDGRTNERTYSECVMKYSLCDLLAERVTADTCVLFYLLCLLLFKPRSDKMLLSVDCC